MSEYLWRFWHRSNISAVCLCVVLGIHLPNAPVMIACAALLAMAMYEERRNYSAEVDERFAQRYEEPTKDAQGNLVARRKIGGSQSTSDSSK